MQVCRVKVALDVTLNVKKHFKFRIKSSPSPRRELQRMAAAAAVRSLSVQDECCDRRGRPCRRAPLPPGRRGQVRSCTSALLHVHKDRKNCAVKTRSRIRD